MIKWFNRYNFPYSNFHDLNLDWIIKEMNRVIEEWEAVKAEWEAMKIEWTEFKAEMQRLWEEYKDLMEAAWEAYKANLNEEWIDYKNEMNAAWLAYQNTLNEAWATYQNTLNAAWEAYQESMNSDFAEFKQTINTEMAEFKAEVEAYLDTLPAQITAWLVEHANEYLAAFLTAEYYGAAGDGVEYDYPELSAMISDAVALKKPIALAPGAVYNLGSNFPFDLPANIVIFGNGATLKTTRGFRLEGTNIVLKDLILDGTVEPAVNDISGLRLENVKVTNLDLSVNIPTIDNAVIKGLIVNGINFRYGTANKPAKDLIAEDITFNNATSAVIVGNGFVRGVRTANGLSPITLSLSGRGGELILESSSNITINKSNNVKEAQYS